MKMVIWDCIFENDVYMHVYGKRLIWLHQVTFLFINFFTFFILIFLTSLFASQ